jgi:hypothetical protein
MARPQGALREWNTESNPGWLVEKNVLGHVVAVLAKALDGRGTFDDFDRVLSELHVVLL